MRELYVSCFIVIIFVLSTDATHTHRSASHPFAAFHGLHKNWLFCALLVLIVVVQTLMTVFGGRFFGTIGLTAREWSGVVVFALIVLPFGALLRLVPIPVDSDGNSKRRSSTTMV
jgi:magnesium-transporting ATPase (P-type)